ncbi:MAG TPA: hypothetical protein PKW61_07465, partial [Tenuifilaceae bacterium]|nr:hypothetical protein [Tenuifilaceae bacterium]
MKNAILKTLVVLAIIVNVLSIATAQTSFLPSNLGTSVNSEYPEINPILHPDGKILYFSRANHPENRFGGINS